MLTITLSTPVSQEKTYNHIVHDQIIGCQQSASAGNRTRIYCLEGNNANLHTTDAMTGGEKHLNQYLPYNGYQKNASAGNQNQIYCFEGNNVNYSTIKTMLIAIRNLYSNRTSVITTLVTFTTPTAWQLSLGTSIHILYFRYFRYQKECLGRESNSDRLLESLR